MFAWQNVPRSKVKLKELEADSLESAFHVSKFDMTLSLQESGNSIAGLLLYATALYDRRTVERYLGYYRRLLEGMVAGGENQVVDVLPILTEEEQRLLVYEWSRIRRDLSGALVPDKLLEERVGKVSEATQVYIVDKESMPVPVGVIGEICFGG